VDAAAQPRESRPPRRRRPVAELPHALGEGVGLIERLARRRPAVFLDYDGTLTPIVDRPEDAILSERMRETVRELAERCPLCIVSGRDRQVVQRLLGIDDLVVAGSHGFDIWSPGSSGVRHEAGAEHRRLLEEVQERLTEAAAPIPGAVVEPKRSSVAVHFRLVPEAERPRVRRLVDATLQAHPGALRVMPGKLVYEIQPDVDWDKGKAVLYLLGALDLDHEDVAPVYVGDDDTDEHAFEALGRRGTGILVRAGAPDDPARTTFADYALDDVDEVRRFLAALAAALPPPTDEERGRQA
jgi:trehalose 6-phosphate phosphatase